MACLLDEPTELILLDLDLKGNNMSYNPTMIIKYDGLPLDPTPQISIERQPIYVGPNIIGYDQSIVLDGYASSVTYGPTRRQLGESSAFKSLNSLRWVEDLLHKNGKTFELWRVCDNTLVLRGHGGQIQEFSTEEGNWVNYIKYNAKLSFSSLETVNGFLGVDPDSIPVRDPLMKEQLRRLKSFDDSWSFNIPENEAYLYYSRLAQIGEEQGRTALVAEDYSEFDISYNIKATGKHFYVNNLTEAAWENAKNFVQRRLAYQIWMLRDGNVLNGNFLQNALYNSNDVGGPMQDAMSSTFISPAFPPIIDRSIVDRYKIYDETIDCSTSEAEGSFSAVYKCKLKRYDTSIAAPKDSSHRFTVTYEQTNEFDNKSRNITVQGSLQGLLPTNILSNVDDGQPLSLPTNGQFFNVNQDVKNKYYYALKDLKQYILNKSMDDLSDVFKRVLDINYASLFPDTASDSPCLKEKGFYLLYSLLADPKSFQISHNYQQGTINYSATYNTERSCVQELGFNSITITEKDSTPMYVEHRVLGRKRGPILQDLNTNTLKEVTIKFDGVTRKGCVSGNPFSTGYELQDPRFTGLSAEVCDTDAYFFLPLSVKATYFATEKGAELLNVPLITKTYNANYNPATGSYSVTKAYSICPPYPEDTTNSCTEEDFERAKIKQARNNV